MNQSDTRFLRPSSPHWLSALLLIVCMLGHWWALRWIDQTTSRPAIVAAWRRPPVQVALLPTLALPPEPTAATPAKPAAPVKPPPLVRRARPIAATPPVKPAPRSDPLAPVTARTEPTIIAPNDTPTDIATDAPADTAEGTGAVASAALPTPSTDGNAAAIKPTEPGQVSGADDAGANDMLKDRAANAAADRSAAIPLPSLPEPTRLRFLIHLGDYNNSASVARLEYSLEHDGKHYALRSQGEATGLTSLFYRGMLLTSSSGRLGRAGVLPERYSEQRGKSDERWAQLNYADKLVSFSSGDTSTMVAGAQDRLSALLQLGLMARASPEQFVTGQIIELPEVNLRNIETTRYRSDGDEVLSSAQGDLRALKLARLPVGGEREAGVEVWLGYEQAMLPVRIRLTDKGGRVIDQMLHRAAP